MWQNPETEMGKWMYTVETEALVTTVNKGDKFQLSKIFN